MTLYIYTARNVAPNGNTLHERQHTHTLLKKVHTLKKKN